MIVSEAPGRAGIIGNPTDGYGGAMIACSIPPRARATIEPAPRLVLSGNGRQEAINWKSDLQLKSDGFDLARAVLTYFQSENVACRLSMETDIPRQAGLAGSTALLSAILGAVMEYLGRDYSLHYFAELNRIIELHYMGVHCGYQDAYMTTFGGLNFLDFTGKEYYRDLEEELYATVEPLEVDHLPLLLAHSGVRHHSGDFHRPIRERWLDGEREVVENYREIASLALEGKRALIDGDYERLGWLMDENHRIQDSLSYSGEQNNELIRAAREGGALGAKLAGAGGGGTIICLTLEPDRTRKAVLEAGAETILGLDPNAPGLTVNRVRSGEAVGG